MTTTRFVAGLAACMIVTGAAMYPGVAPPWAQAQADAPSPEQLRQAVSQLRAGRIEAPTSYDALNPEQQAYVRSILDGPRSSISGPLGVMLVSPGLGDLLQKSMAYARFAGRDGFSGVPPKLNELVILLVAKHWSAEYVWNAHHGYAVRMGLPAEVVESIRIGRRPERMEADVEAVYNFAQEFLTMRDVSDGRLEAARAVLGGDRGVIDLVGTMGLYQISSMMVAVDRTPLPEGTQSYFHR